MTVGETLSEDNGAGGPGDSDDGSGPADDVAGGEPAAGGARTATATAPRRVVSTPPADPAPAAVPFDHETDAVAAAAAPAATAPAPTAPAFRPAPAQPAVRQAPAQPAPVPPPPGAERPAARVAPAFGDPYADRRYRTVGRSAVDHRRLVVVFAVIGLLVGGAYGVVRHPSYTAQARIVVGTNISLVNEAASAGLPAAEQAFAAEYARLITTQAVEVATAKALKVSSLPGSLSATPIADSNIIDVNASASSSAAAVAVASAGAVALVTEVNALNTANASTVSTLLSDYNNVQIQINNLTVQQDIVRGKISYLQGLSSLSAVQQGQLAALNKQAASIQAQISTAELQATALSNQYQSQYSPDQADADTVKVSSPGSATGSDRKTFLEIGVLGGLVGGAVVGLALAVAADVRAPARPGGRGGAPEPVAAA